MKGGLFAANSLTTKGSYSEAITSRSFRWVMFALAFSLLSKNAGLEFGNGNVSK
jgi:hypothetical protein